MLMNCANLADNIFGKTIVCWYLDLHKIKDSSGREKL